MVVAALGSPGHEHRNGASGPAPTESADSGGDVDILVVDDDGALRSTWAAILRGRATASLSPRTGTSPCASSGNGRSAWSSSTCACHAATGCRSWESCAAPQLVVLVSAHALDDATRAEVDAKIVTFLEKPVPPNLLLETVSASLGPGGRTAT